MVKPVPERLSDLGSIYRERNEVYGDDFRRYGRVIMALFPDGVKLDNEQDANRFGVLTQMIAKFGRYCSSFAVGGHADSLDDLAVYAQILSLLDEERNAIPFPDDGIARPEFRDPSLARTVSGDEDMADMYAFTTAPAITAPITCQMCQGTGTLDDIPCPWCQGQGEVRQ